jgi:hypothetical protein
VLRWLLVEVLRALSIAPGLSGISLQVRRVAFEAGDEAFPTTASLRGRPRWSGLAFMAPFPRREPSIEHALASRWQALGVTQRPERELSSMNLTGR